MQKRLEFSYLEVQFLLLSSSCSSCSCYCRRFSALEPSSSFHWLSSLELLHNPEKTERTLSDAAAISAEIQTQVDSKPLNVLQRLQKGAEIISGGVPRKNKK